MNFLIADTFTDSLAHLAGDEQKPVNPGMSLHKLDQTRGKHFRSVRVSSDTSRPFPQPESARIAVKVINHLSDEAMKVSRVD